VHYDSPNNQVSNRSSKCTTGASCFDSRTSEVMPMCRENLSQYLADQQLSENNGRLQIVISDSKTSF
jgi:hypothetical protein